MSGSRARVATRIFRSMKSKPLSRAKVEKTAWARNFRKAASACYQEALRYASNPDLRVRLYWNTESGSLQCAVVPESDGSFWLGAADSRKEAAELCRLMGWNVVGQNSKESVLSYMMQRSAAESSRVLAKRHKNL